MFKLITKYLCAKKKENILAKSKTIIIPLHLYYIELDKFLNPG